ncbi:MAG TPA: sugar phosphate isomerase/epimerase, partial [Anaerolineae bacterium]
MESQVLAAQLYTLREFCKTADDFAKSMHKVRDIGYTAVQVSGIGPLAPAEVKAVLDANGLT